MLVVQLICDGFVSLAVGSAAAICTSTSSTSASSRAKRRKNTLGSDRVCSSRSDTERRRRSSDRNALQQTTQSLGLGDDLADGDALVGRERRLLVLDQLQVVQEGGDLGVEAVVALAGTRERTDAAHGRRLVVLEARDRARVVGRELARVREPSASGVGRQAAALDALAAVAAVGVGHQHTTISNYRASTRDIRRLEQVSIVTRGHRQ